MNKNLECALFYAEKLGYSVIPVGSDKKPYVKWERFQKEKPDSDTIRKWWFLYPEANIGIVTGTVSAICVIDIDEPEGEQELQKLIPDSLTIPSSVTPRGGKHLYFQYPAAEKICNNSRIVKGCDFRGEGGYIIAPPSRNGTGIPYKWVLNPVDSPPPPLPDAYIDYVKANPKYVDSLKKSQIVLNSLKLFTDGRRDEDLFHVANCLIRGGASSDVAYQVLEILAQNCQPEFEAELVSAKVASALKRAERKERNISEDVRRWVEVSEGIFKVSECHIESQVVSKEDKHAVVLELLRLAKEGVIEKYGDRRGCYRKVSKEEVPIDIFNIENQRLNIKYPFQIEELMLTLPKNIIIIAGEPNVGKTSFLLQFARLNLDSHKVFFFSSEMGGLELRSRLEQLDNYDIENWKKLQFIERASNFADLLRPDDVNVIDFLEIHNDFFKVGEYIKNIFDRLRNGIAVIGLQKNRGRDEGLGGFRSLEKARLYLAMERQKLKIVKAKNWQDPKINPNRLCLDFRLHKGINFEVVRYWYREDEERQDYQKSRKDIY